MFEGFVSESIISRAIKFGAVEVNIIDIRDYCFDKHKQADDMPFWWWKWNGYEARATIFSTRKSFWKSYLYITTRKNF